MKTIREADVLRVVEELSEWQSVADILGFGFQCITDIEKNHRDEESRRKAFFGLPEMEVQQPIKNFAMHSYR